jgi:hypothetical protein
LGLTWIKRETEQVHNDRAPRYHSFGDQVMRRIRVLVALLGMFGAACFCTAAQAETGRVAVLFTKGGFILGVGGGEGVLTLRGNHYPFTVSGMSVGFSLGASTTKFVGEALNLRGPGSIEGNYGAVGAGGALAGGAGGVRLQNSNGVVLVLSGPKVGVEVSAAVAGVAIRLK